MEFNASQLPEGTSSFDPIPAGWYKARCVDSEAKVTKNGDGAYMSMQWEVLGPNHANRRIFGNITLKNPNSEAEDIGLKQLRALLESTGVTSLKIADPERGRPVQVPQLLGKICEIKVAIRPARDQYEASNDIKGFRSAGGSPLPVAAASSSAAPAATARKPWEK